MASLPQRVGLLYEHPTWSLELIERLTGRGVEVTAVDVGAVGATDRPRIGDPTIDRWINRVAALPSAGRSPSVLATTGHLLLELELWGRQVINGHRTWAIGASKQAQSSLFGHLGLDTPRSIAIDDPAEAPAAATEVGFPILIKPNVGGSGSGIVRYDRLADLRADVEIDTGQVGLGLGLDGTGLVQRVIESTDGIIHRVEMLGQDLFYATDQPIEADVFNYCAADGCAIGGGIALVEPSVEVVDAAALVMAAAGADVGGIEYLIDRATGRPCYFDFNPYSNLVVGRDAELGFDPIERYLDHVLA